MRVECEAQLARGTLSSCMRRSDVAAWIGIRLRSRAPLMHRESPTQLTHACRSFSNTTDAVVPAFNATSLHDMGERVVVGAAEAVLK